MSATTLLVRLRCGLWQILRLTALAVTAEGASCAARAVPSDRACPAYAPCWLLDVSRLIASYADGVAGRRARAQRRVLVNPAAMMLQHILNKNNSCNHGSRPRLPYGFRAGAGIGFRITSLQAASSVQIRAGASYTFIPIPSGREQVWDKHHFLHARIHAILWLAARRCRPARRRQRAKERHAPPRPAGAPGGRRTNNCAWMTKLVVYNDATITARVLVRFL